jgi:hypothetical protein
MTRTRHAVDGPYTRQELEALFRLANEQDVERGGRYDARAVAINVWSHHWAHRATREDSDLLGTFYVQWAPTPRLYQIEVEAGFTLEDLLHELGQLERQALGVVKHGEVGGEGP